MFNVTENLKVYRNLDESSRSLKIYMNTQRSLERNVYREWKFKSFQKLKTNRQISIKIYAKINKDLHKSSRTLTRNVY